MLPNTPVERAAVAAERIRAAIRGEVEVPGRGEQGFVTMSAGIEADGSAEPTELYQWADQALYQAKRDGRDRVAFAKSGKDNEGG